MYTFTERQILDPRYWSIRSISKYWNIIDVSVLAENLILSVIQKLAILEHKKWATIVQYLYTNIWDLKYTVSCLSYL